jgi:hypothetical protein
VLDGLERRASNVMGRHLLTHVLRFSWLSRSTPAGCSNQESVDVQTAVPPELQMLLVESSSLMTKPCVTEICMRVDWGGIEGHGKLLCEDRERPPPVRGGGRRV